MTKQDRLKRVIARGEGSNHAHIIVGDALITEEKGETIITVGGNGAVLKHLLETEWLSGTEAWSGEHHDIPLEKGVYKHVHQVEYDPYDEVIRKVKD